MPRIARELSAIEVKRLVEPGFWFVGGVPGLALQVSATGGRSWVLRTMIGTRRRDLGLGGYPEVSLADARDRARQARQKVREGVDPAAEREAARAALRAAQAAAMTFAQCADRYIDAHRAGWRNPKHAAQWQATVEQYANPILGSLSVADVAVPHVLKVLEQPVPVNRNGDLSEGTERLWIARTETASRLRGRIESILDWAKGRGYRSGENPAAWKGNLDALLPRPEKVARVEHFAAIAIDEMPAFLAALRQREGVAARALEFTILTAARSGEVRGAVWSEIDLDAGLWTVPASRMKAGREHRVALSDAAIELLDEMPRFAGTDVVFPAARGGPLSDMALTAVMRRMNRSETVHGFRSAFRDWCAERTGYPGELAELALAHAIGNAVEAAYRRGDQLEKRRKMMSDWADFCEHGSPAGATIVELSRRTVA